jgi:hypothetical protein
MMPAGPARPPAALTLLFGPGDAAEALGHAVVSAAADGSLGRALAHLPPEARTAAVREVTAAAAGLLDVGLADVLITGWREHRDLTAAARRTLAAPGSTELVDLAEHQVTSTQEPYVSVLVDGHQVATVQLGLTVVCDVTAMLAGISAGRLVAVHSGACDVTVTLAIDEAEVITRRLRCPASSPCTEGSGCCPRALTRPPQNRPKPLMTTRLCPRTTRSSDDRYPGRYSLAVHRGAGAGPGDQVSRLGPT